MKSLRTVLAVATVFALGDAQALTIHRSFASRSVRFGGGIGCDVPIDAKVAAALDEAREKEAARPKVYVGRVTRVLSGNELVVVTDGGTRVPVKLDGIVVSESGRPEGRAATDFLKALVQGRQVRVEYFKRDDRGWVLGTITFNKADVGQTMVEKGMAKRADKDFAAASVDTPSVL